MNPLEHAAQLKSKLDDLRPLSPEIEARIMQKFRLDWNYHSNNLEGNTLTYGETKALILFGVTAQGKPLRDHFEITGHNEAINWVLDLVRNETPLTEKFIRELHTLVLKEDSFKDALTPDGQPTRRKIEVGKYKTQPNHVVTVTGETFFFASPEETPAKMQELVDWFREERGRPNANPIALAAVFHYRFILIHPFDDGNGRVARILMNFILMQFGYPPVIIRTEDRENYFGVLRLADAGELQPFVDYVAENLIRSLELMIRGAKGEEIDDPEDLSKELAILKARVRSVGRQLEMKRSPQTIKLLFEKSIKPAAADYFKAMSDFRDLYFISHGFIEIDSKRTNGELDSAIQEASMILNQKPRDVQSIKLRFLASECNQDGLANLRFESQVSFDLQVRKYRVLNHEGSVLIEHSYTEQLSSEEINSLVQIEVRRHLDTIKSALSEFHQPS